MPDTVIITQPDNPVEEDITWQSVLSEVRQAILDGFSSLRLEMENQRSESLLRENRLLEQNTSLTNQITSANQTLMEKLSSLTSVQSTPEVVIVSEPILESAVDVSPVAEIVPVEENEVVPARPKRRTL